MDAFNASDAKFAIGPAQIAHASSLSPNGKRDSYETLNDMNLQRETSPGSLNRDPEESTATIKPAMS